MSQAPFAPLTLCRMHEFRATAALPYDNLERATAGLRAALMQQLLAAGVREAPVWETFVVTGPIVFEDLRGRDWYEYRASVESRRPFDWESPQH